MGTWCTITCIMEIISKFRCRFVRISLLLAMATFVVFPAVNEAATLSTNFSAGGELVQGNIVSLDKDGRTVIRANRDNIANLHGVVVNSSDVSFSQNNDNGVSVASTGVIETLVSDVNGEINSGDPITVNLIEGIGEKALGVGKVIGVAQGSFDGTNGTSYTYTQDGESKTIKIGTIPVKVEVSNYGGKQGSASAQDSNLNRSKILQVADGLAGKQVKAIALIIGFLFVLIGGFVATFLITSSGYASMISVGRNPLSEKKVLKALARVLLIAIGVFLTGLSLAYVTIKLV